VEILPSLSPRVLDWLSSSVDLSMVASAWGLDPLAHREDAVVRLVNKTGTSDGVRADIGLVEAGGRRTAYAAIANWDADRDDLRGPVLAAMRGLGGLVPLG
jgi:beta-lactamase class A